MSEADRADDRADVHDDDHPRHRRRGHAAIVLQEIGEKILRPVRQKHHERHQHDEIDQPLRMTAHRAADLVIGRLGRVCTAWNRRGAHRGCGGFRLGRIGREIGASAGDALGGGDPVSAIHDWGPRINHVHLKDVRRSVIDAVIREGGDLMQVWRRGAFCRLGTGDLDIDAILNGLRARAYRGWLVVEQDVIPGLETQPDAAAVDQDRNRAYLRARGL